MAVYISAALVYLRMTGSGAGIGLGDKAFRTSATFFGGMTGFVNVLIVICWPQEYTLYTDKARHSAVMVELLDDRPVPDGRSQIGHAQAGARLLRRGQRALLRSTN